MNKSYQSPLEEQELKRTIEKIQTTNDQEAMITMMKHYSWIIYTLLSKFSNFSYEQEDLFHIAQIALMKSIKTFSLEKNYKFSSYAYACIKNEILQLMRKERQQLPAISLNQSQSFHDHREGEEYALEEIIADAKVNIELDYLKLELSEELREVLLRLSPREQELIRLRFGFIEDRIYTQEEIAKILHVSQSYIARMIAKTLKKIKSELTNHENQGLSRVKTRN